MENHRSVRCAFENSRLDSLPLHSQDIKTVSNNYDDEVDYCYYYECVCASLWILESLFIWNMSRPTTQQRHDHFMSHRNKKKIISIANDEH